MNFFSQGNPCNENRVPAMRTGFPCNENRFFPVRKSSQGKPCSDPVLALYGIAVKNILFKHEESKYFWKEIMCNPNPKSTSPCNDGKAANTPSLWKRFLQFCQFTVCLPVFIGEGQVHDEQPTHKKAYFFCGFKLYKSLQHDRIKSQDLQMWWVGTY